MRAGFFNYTVSADITDITGEVVSISKVINLGEAPFRISDNIPSTSFIEDLPLIKIDLKNCEDKVIGGQVELRMFSLKNPNKAFRTRYWKKNDVQFISDSDYNSRFPHDGRQDELNPANWDVLKVLDQISVNAGEDIEQFQNLDRGTYKVEITATDSEGNKLQESRYIHISDALEKALPTQQLWVSNLDGFYSVGDKLKLNINVPHDDYQVFYRIVQKNKELKRDWIDDDEKSITFDIEETHYGGFGIEVIFIIHNRLYKKNIPVKVPWENKELQINVESFRNKILPGAKENWTVSIADYEGNPAKAEIVASMYDSSLDQFIPFAWNNNFYPSFYNNINWSGVGFRKYNFANHHKNLHGGYNTQISGFTPQFDWFGYYLNSPVRIFASQGFEESPMASPVMRSKSKSADMVVEEESLENEVDDSGSIGDNGTKTDQFSYR